MASIGGVSTPAAAGPQFKLAELSRHFEAAVKRLYENTERLRSSNDRILGSMPAVPPVNSAVPTPIHAVGVLEIIETDLRHALAFLEQEVSRVEEL